MTAATKSPIWFWAFAFLALLWNSAGLAAFIDQLTLNASDLTEMSDAKRIVFANPPMWTMLAFGCAVTCGFLGAIFLLFRRRIATLLFILSLFAVAIQFGSYFIVEGYLEYLGGQGWTMPVLIAIVAICLVWYSRFCQHRKLLR